MVNNKEVIGHLMDIKQDVAGINEHLKTLNSKVAKNVKEIEKNRNGVFDLKTDFKTTMAKWGGAIATILVVVQLAITYLKT